MNTKALNVALMMALAAGPTAAQADVRAKLSGFQEVLSVFTDATGSFRASLKGSGSELKYRLSYAGIESPLFAHIHFGERHQNGGVIAFLCNNEGAVPDGAPVPPPCQGYADTIHGVLTSDDIIGPGNQAFPAGDFEALVEAVNAGAVYVNVHSVTFPAGELRGQLRGRLFNRGYDDYEDGETDD